MSAGTAPAARPFAWLRTLGSRGKCAFVGYTAVLVGADTLVLLLGFPLGFRTSAIFSGFCASAYGIAVVALLGLPETAGTEPEQVYVHTKTRLRGRA